MNSYRQPGQLFLMYSERIGVVTRSQKNRNETEVKIVRIENENRNKNSYEMSNESLVQVIQLLTLKINADEIDRRNGRDRNIPSISAENFANIVSDFDGESTPVKLWLNNFEQNADAYGLIDQQKYVQPRGKMVRLAKVFPESEVVITFDQLKCANGRIQTYNAKRKTSRKEEEQGREFSGVHLFIIKNMASQGSIDKESLIA